MVPDKFNMVDLGGIDLIMMQGEAVSGLYEKLIAAISNCRYQCLYNWLFDGVLIPPAYVQLTDNDGEVYLNEGVSVTSDDVIHIYSIEPPAPEPEIIPLLAEENGVYNVPTGKDGFNPVTVNVPSYTPVINPISISENGTYSAPAGVDGYSPVTVNVPSYTPVINPITITENGIYTAPAGVDGYSPVTVNIIGDEKIYAVKGDNLDAILGGIGGNVIETADSGAYRVVTPMCILTNRSPSQARFYIQRNSSYFSNKPCLYTTNANLTSISCPSKIIAGEYSKLVIEYVIASRATNPGFIIGCGSALSYDNYAFRMNLKSTNLAVASDPTGTVLTKELDISDIAQDFYFGMYQWGYQLYIRNFYVTK